MPEARSVSVVLRAITSQYQSAMARASATMRGFGVTASGVGAGMGKVGTAMQTAGRSMSQVGGTLTRNVSLPLLAAGGYAVKMALDFDEAFTKIRANSNLTQREIDDLRKVVLDLSGTTAQAPEELAEGLYFLASAGLNAQQVQETLTMSAKASAAGFGSVGEVARLTANALNAYEKEGLTAAEVTDTLAAAIREGTAEPSEFAGALGRILPIAQKSGVGFDQVTASLASLSNIGLDVNEGVTAMRGVLQAIQAPGKQAKEALEDVGLSADQLRDVLARDGVLAAFDLLEEKTGGNIDKLRDIVPNIRALSGLFGITGQNADKVAASYERVGNATGDLNKAFDKTKDSDAFKMEQLKADLKKLAITVGEDLMPVVRDAAEVISDLAKSFSELSPEMRKNILKWGAWAIALGPVLRILGGLSRVGGGGLKILERLARVPAPTTTTPTPGTPTTTVPPAVPAPVTHSWKLLGARLGAIGAVAVTTKVAFDNWLTVQKETINANNLHAQSIQDSHFLMTTLAKSVKNGTMSMEQFERQAYGLVAAETNTIQETAELAQKFASLRADLSATTRVINGTRYSVESLVSALNSMPRNITTQVSVVQVKGADPNFNKPLPGDFIPKSGGGKGGTFQSYSGAAGGDTFVINAQGSTMTPGQFEGVVRKVLDQSNRRSGDRDRARAARVA